MSDLGKRARCDPELDNVLTIMATRLVEMEKKTSEYQCIAGRAARALDVNKEKLWTFKQQALEQKEKIASAIGANQAMGEQLLKLEEDVHTVKARVETVEHEKAALLNESLHDFMSRPKTCPLCEEKKRLCVVMPCFHTFCQRCIIKWSQNKKDELTCPVCRRGIQGTHDFETGMMYELSNHL